MRLQGKHVLVTGSSTGIGKAIARRCLAEGAKIVVHGVEPDLTKATATELGNAPYHISDLADPATPQTLIDFTVAELGSVDSLVNNAGVVPHADITNTTLELWDHTHAINVRAPFLLIQAALPHLQKSHGRVLNIGSVNAYGGESTFLPYATSKGAIMTLTRNLGDALNRSHGVVVNQINPGWVLTENEAQRKRENGLSDNWPSELPPVYAPSGRILKPEEIAEAAVYWLSDAAGPVSGCVVELEQYPAMGRNPDKV
ncbi:MAG: SDR family oxidoreductase [Verrucomicrobiales bacterium]|nr:SDR family oxidoreductase [Verrucomicrobiales bacterium]